MLNNSDHRSEDNNAAANQTIFYGYKFDDEMVGYIVKSEAEARDVAHAVCHQGRRSYRIFRLVAEEL